MAVPAAGTPGTSPVSPAAVPAARAPGAAGVALTPRSGEVVLNFQGADLQAVVKAMSQMTGRNMLIDPRVRGQVTIVSARALAGAPPGPEFFLLPADTGVPPRPRSREAGGVHHLPPGPTSP